MDFRYTSDEEAFRAKIQYNIIGERVRKLPKG
jgi:hypothetical protein